MSIKINNDNYATYKIVYEIIFQEILKEAKLGQIEDHPLAILSEFD